MKKKVLWPEPATPKRKVPKGHYGSMREKIQKSEALRREQEEASNYLKKAGPVMEELFNHRISKGTPLIVMRPLIYKSSGLNTDNDDNDGFYNTSSSSSMPKFVDKNVTLMPGTQLVLKSIDPNLMEFIFHDGVGKEHAINFEEKGKILTQTNIFETVKEFLNKIGE